MVPTEGKRYAPFGRCIYCLATEYSHSRRTLGDEHIIPLGLNGTFVLPEAACETCERAINKYEGYLQGRVLAPLRYLMGLKTRKPKDRPEFIAMTANLIGGGETRVQVPAWFAPASLVMPIFGYPGLFSDAPPETSEAIVPQLMHQPIGLPEMMAIWSFGRNIDSVRPPSVSFTGNMFAQLMAKIAYGYAVAQLPKRISEFRHIADIVLGKETDVPMGYYVGSEPGRGPESTNLHEIHIESRESPTRQLTVVKIRLFAHLMSPTYYVVVSPRL